MPHTRASFGGNNFFYKFFKASRNGNLFYHIWKACLIGALIVLHLYVMNFIPTLMPVCCVDLEVNVVVSFIYEFVLQRHEYAAHIVHAAYSRQHWVNLGIEESFVYKLQIVWD